MTRGVDQHSPTQDANPTIVELGAGSLRKTSHILLALARSHQTSSPPLRYYALDLERRELLRTLDQLNESIGEDIKGKVEASGMWGTYDGGIAFIKNGGLTHEPNEDCPKDSPTALNYRRTSYRHIPESVTPRGLASTPILETPTGVRAQSPISRSSSPSTFPGTGISSSERELTGTMPSSPPLSPNLLPAEDENPSDHPPLHLLFLGSSIGNFNRNDAVEFLSGLPLRPGSGDTLLLGLDHRNEASVIERAYNDSAGVTRAFMLNGLRGAERILNGLPEEGNQDVDYGDLIKKDGWEYVGRWNEKEGRHEGYYRSVRRQDIVIPADSDRPHEPIRNVPFDEGELINVEYSYKYSDHEAYSLFEASKLRAVYRWKDATERYSLWLLERPSFLFPLLPSLPSTPSISRASFTSVPTLAEWSELWTLWDTITMGMIPPNMLHQKPIDLRHKCLFYLGHIPAFLDIQLGKVLKGEEGEPEKAGGAVEPLRFRTIFERGIDPHVDDPTQCHPHSEVPQADEDWPALQEIVAYRDRVRSRLVHVYEEFGTSEEGRPGVRLFDRTIGRALWMVWEHEAFHAETLLYMLIQRAGVEDGTIPPKGFIRPSWEALAALKEWVTPLASTVETVTLEPSTISVGHDDLEDEDKLSSEPQNSHEYGWDNESPRRTANVGRVRIENRPILNGEYHDFWRKLDGEKALPASWVLTENGDVQIRTLYGPVPLSVAQNWPFIGAYDELFEFAKSKGGRLPNEAELLLYRDLYEGSEETNVGFKHWHPIPPQLPGSDKRGHNGGVWEWTCSIMDTYEGFKSSWIYPGYSSDFFDGLHHVVLGGSYATAPRLSQRRSLRNFYQHNYPYAWIGGRVAYD
ncbi:hypothetical protein FRC02_010420 [Tulasnella sp. 418]|nr:hypothetical protein FRC02_010420 [Tulasnella sp. 418]